MLKQKVIQFILEANFTILKYKLNFLCCCLCLNIVQYVRKTMTNYIFQKSDLDILISEIIIKQEYTFALTFEHGRYIPR